MEEGTTDDTLQSPLNTASSNQFRGLGIASLYFRQVRPRAFLARSVTARWLPLRVVTLDTCVRKVSRFTGCSLGEASQCDVQFGAVSRH